MIIDESTQIDSPRWSIQSRAIGDCQNSASDRRLSSASKNDLDMRSQRGQSSLSSSVLVGHNVDMDLLSGGSRDIGRPSISR